MEIVEDFVFQIGISLLNEYMKIYEIKRSTTFFQTFSGPSCFDVSNISSKATGPMVQTRNFIQIIQRWRERIYICFNCSGHLTSMATAPIYGKTR